MAKSYFQTVAGLVGSSFSKTFLISSLNNINKLWIFLDLPWFLISKVLLTKNDIKNEKKSVSFTLQPKYFLSVALPYEFQNVATLKNWETPWWVFVALSSFFNKDARSVHYTFLKRMAKWMFFWKIWRFWKF